MSAATASQFNSRKAAATLAAARAWRVLRAWRADLPLLAVMAWRTVRTPRRRTGVQEAPSEPQEIVVVRLDAMGDLIMTTPIFRELRLRYPGARITAVIQGRNRALLANNPFVDEIVSPPEVQPSRWFLLARRGLALVRLYRAHFRGRRVDIVLQPRLDQDYYSSTVLLRLLDAPLTVRFAGQQQRGLSGAVERLAARSMLQVPRPSARQEALTNLVLAQAVTGTVATSVPQVFPGAREQAYADQVFITAELSGHTVIAMSFGAQARRRTWPVERWAEALNEIAAASASARGVAFLLLCSRSEQDDARGLAAAIASAPALVLAGAGLLELSACLARCRLFIGPDSGLAHLAAASGCPPLVLSPHPVSGSPEHENSPARFLPLHPQARVVRPAVPRPPCVDGCDATFPHCILDVATAELARAATEMLRPGEAG